MCLFLGCFIGGQVKLKRERIYECHTKVFLAGVLLFLISSSGAAAGMLVDGDGLSGIGDGQAWTINGASYTTATSPFIIGNET